ncbi:hypothetical protein KJ742_04580 [Patescibacteria group bacterium]|nr:hypothetical protein [Patescibacteria group bacterium]MBU1683195.1 hypothetical protein [Patescibacteria group bacterium]
MDLSKKFKKFALNARFESIAWGLFLVMIGVLWLYPEGRFPEDTWLLGTGIILLGLNAVRHMYGLHISIFTTLLGLIALVAGLDDYLGYEIPILPILIIIFGVSILLGPSLIKNKVKKGSWFCCKGSCEKWFEE